MKSQVKTDLVHVSHGKPFTNSVVIATGINNGTFDNKKHRLTIALIRKHKARLEKFGRVLFQTAPIKTELMDKFVAEYLVKHPRLQLVQS
jgi:hypothetical protein